MDITRTDGERATAAATAFAEDDMVVTVAPTRVYGFEFPVGTRAVVVEVIDQDLYGTDYQYTLFVADRSHPDNHPDHPVDGWDVDVKATDITADRSAR